MIQIKGGSRSRPHTYEMSHPSTRSNKAVFLETARRELQAERSRLLIILKDGCDKLRQIERLSEGAGTGPLILAHEIVIAVAERETFADVPAERIPIVLNQIEYRLLHLKRMLRDVQSKGRCVRVTPSAVRDAAFWLH